jgi:hypothetical protein
LPQNRPNWNEWSQNRNQNWQQRVDNRSNAWNNWQQNNQQRINNFQSNQQQRWDNLESAQQNRQDWRNQAREDWQDHRNELWDYRSDRAEQVWDNARDYYDDCFDDRWWGNCAWGYGHGYYGFGSYVSNPWWWWAPAAWGAVSSWVGGVASQPYYTDYGMNVNYEGDTVYVNNQAVPAAQYSQPMINLAVNVEQPPPPTPPAEGQKAEWLPLGVFALAQEEKGDPIMIVQLSVNRDGVISGAYNSTITEDQRPIAGQVDKASQQVAFRIGANTDTIFVTSLANLTKDVAPITLHFGTTRTQVWLLVRMPEPAAAGQTAGGKTATGQTATAIPTIDRKPPPIDPAAPIPGMAAPPKAGT